MINVLVIDDHPIVMDGLNNLFANYPEISVVGYHSDGQSGFDALQHTPARVVLLDINLPDTNGISLCRKIKVAYPHVSILALSLHNERPVIKSMVQNGAMGYVLKNAPGHEIMEGIRAVSRGQTYYCTATKRALADAASSHLETVPLITRREKEVLQLIGEGMTSQEVAEKLFISTHTVESHRKKLMEKFEVKNIISVIKLASEYGLL